MPTTPLGPCRMPRCPGRATHRGYCATHAHQQEQQRGSAHARGYDKTWQALRLRYLRAHPTCMHCDRAATDVDHVLSVRQRPDLRLSWSNLRALCHRCHSRRTAVDQLGWGGTHGPMR